MCQVQLSVCRCRYSVAFLESCVQYIVALPLLPLCYSRRMRLFGNRIAVLLSIYVVVAFTSASSLHSIVQHDDTDTSAGAMSACEVQYGYGHCPEHTGSAPDAHPSAQWAYIHSVLGSEGKSGMGVVPTSQSLIGMYLADECSGNQFICTPRLYPDTNERQMSRGVFAYRRFG